MTNILNIISDLSDSLINVPLLNLSDNEVINHNTNSSNQNNQIYLNNQFFNMPQTDADIKKAEESILKSTDDFNKNKPLPKLRITLNKENFKD